MNGYSGFTPASHLARVDQMAAFPDQTSLQRLRRDGVRYVIVHLVEFEPDAREPLVESLVDESDWPNWLSSRMGAARR